ncbi:MAG: DegT/DnrJ/EryC1/StrS family aminotransferase [Spirochaetes bacterium]|nr:DegT/DnrJ/EryC1/StrS family aminotransferase [Spirochaetota bacterium]
MHIPVYSSYIRRKDMDTVLNCLMTDSIGPGEYLEKFLKQSREMMGFEAASAFRSPITALRTALDCLGLTSGDRVAISALSPVYHANVLSAKGFEVVWLDVEEDTASPSAADIEACGAKACILYEASGAPLDDVAISAMRMQLIEDISMSFGAFSGGRKAGSSGIFTILGLEGGGILTAGGGALLYANQRRDAAVLRNTADELPREHKLSDMNAALGFSQLREFEKGRQKRRELDELFSQSLGRTRYRGFSNPENGEKAHYGFPVVLSGGVKDVRTYAKKKDVGTALAFEGSCAAVGIAPEGACPIAASLANRCVTFPLHARIGKTGAQKIARVLATLP